MNTVDDVFHQMMGERIGKRIKEKIMTQMTIHPQRHLAAIARECKTKKELATRLKGAELKEAWRIKQIQNERWKAVGTAVIDNVHYTGGHGYDFMAYYMTPKPLDDYDRERIKPEYRDQCRRWPIASRFRWSFQARIAKSIELGWSYLWGAKEYSVDVRHDRHEVSVKGSRAASSYTTYYVTLTFDLLRQEAVWIGGLLTIRAKADRNKSEYPCYWLERKKDGPGLIVRKGHITRGDHHEEDKTIVEMRRMAARVKRMATTKPPKGSGWVTRQTSLDAGNCGAGTDSFIRNSLVPHFQKLGYTVGNLAGLAVRYSLVLELERSSFTRRLREVA